jgi:uncharacterized protein (TIGR03435 family)
MEIHGRQIEMASLTKLLSGILGRPVLDKIGIAEKFDINVEFACDELTPGIPVPALATGLTKRTNPQPSHRTVHRSSCERLSL